MHFIPKKMIAAYCEGSDKAVFNLLKYSKVPIDVVYLVDYAIPDAERERLCGLKPDLIFTDNIMEALSTDGDTLLWTREVFVSEADYKNWQKILCLAAEHKKNIYNLARLIQVKDNPLVKYAIRQNNVTYFDASSYALHMSEIIPFGDYPPGVTNAKVALILGMERRCGKFTTTQVIHNRLTQRGFQVAEVATEPYGLLTDADYVIIPQIMPMWRATPAVRHIVSHLDKTLRPDIILVSSQSGVRASALDAAGRCGGIIAHTIALGAIPDVCILSVPFHSISLAAKERTFLEFLLEKPVAGMAIKGLDQSRERVAQTMSELRADLKIPVFDPIRDPNTIDELIDSLVDLIKESGE
ncbi:MAG: hypothetical protein B6244_12095 [Candidatus Cloacimonetes bacterium 4572_55]|nr:MAG: hypothetical protein B6244_12095 [Candidatus Cloacimonetes bacterium 4572_55]